MRRDLFELESFGRYGEGRYTYCGMKVVLDPTLADTVVDWAKARSPSRAMRRVRQGKRHHLPMTKRPKREAFKLGDTLVMHPEMWKEIEVELAREAERLKRDMLRGLDPQNWRV